MVGGQAALETWLANPENTTRRCAFPSADMFNAYLATLARRDIDSVKAVLRRILPAGTNGLTWIVNLLPDHFEKALQVLDAYDEAMLWHLPDLEIHALSEVESIIRRRFIGVAQQP
jgi:hypothetical protein